jgi:autotransporter-associated beta strand protein
MPLASPVAHAGTTWDGGGGATTNINTAANWDSDALPSSLTDGTQTLTFGTGGSTATINTDVNALGLVINRDANFTIADGGGNLTVGTGGITVTLPNTTARTHTISENNLILGGNQTWSVTNNTGTATLNVSSAISDGSSTFGISKNGTGVLALSGANTYDGGTTINAGTLTISNNTALGSTVGGTTIASGASLNLQGNITVGAEALAHNGGTSGFLRNVSGNNTWNGDITVGAGNSRIESAAGLLTIGGNITMTLTPIFQGAGNISITGVVSGSSTLSLGAGMTGVVTLSGNNTYTLGTMVSAGTLSVSSMNNQSTSGVFGNNAAQIYLGAATTNATLQYTGTGVTTNRQIRVANAVTDSGNAIIRNDGSGALVFSNAAFNQATGSTTVSRTLTLGGTNTDLNTIQGVIVDNTATTGLVGLIKADAGTWVLSGANTYSGATTINNGILVFRNTSARSANTAVTVGAAGIVGLGVGAGSGDYSDANVAALFNSSLAGFTLNATSGVALDTTAGNFTQSTALTASRALTKLGNNTLTLTGSNTYSGNTTISAGTLALGGSGSLGGGAYSGNISNSGTFTLNTTATQTLSGIISGNGSLTKSNTGTLTLSGSNTYSGSTTVSAGVINIQHANGLGTTANGTTVSSGAALQLQGGITVGAEALSLTGNGVSTDGALRNISGSNTYGGAITLAGATRINSDADLLTLSGGISGTQNLTIGGAGNTTVSNAIATTTGTLTKDGAGTLVLSGANSYTGTTTISAGNLTISGGSAISDSGVVTLGNSTGANLHVAASETIGTLSGGGSNGGDISIAASQALTVNQTATGTFAGIVSGGGALTKNGSSTLTLTGSNTYDGVTTINAGTLTISNNTALGSTVGGTTIASGASLNLQGNITVGAEALTHNGGTSGFLRNVSGNNTWNGDITIGAGNSRIESAAGLLTIGGNITMTSAPIFQGAGNISITGVVSGAQTFTMGAGMSGVLTLSGNNTFTLSIMVNSGTLSVSSMNNPNTSGVFGNTLTNAQVYLGGATTNGTLQYTGNGVTTTRQIRIGGASASGVTDIGNAIIRNDGSGALVFSSGTFNQATASTTANRTLTLGGTNTDLNTIQGAIVDNTASTGLVGLIKADAGTWVLSGSNTYSGATSINNGTLVFRNTSARSANTAVTVAGTGVVGLGVGAGSGDYSDANVAALFNSTLTGFTLNAASGVALDTTAGNFTQSTAFTASRSLTKLGNNTLTLTGSNTYSGDTTISAGTLALGGSGLLGGGSYSGNMANSGTFTLNTTAAQSLSGIISGNGALTKSNTGTLTLSGNNTYSGGTTVSGGTLLLSGAGTLGTSAISISGGTLDMGGKSLTNTFGSLTAGTLSNGTLTNNGGNYDLQNGTVSAVLAGTNGVNKTTSSTLTLTGANTYDGTTAITAGNLTISNNTALGSTVGGTTIASGASLNLQGDITVGAEVLTHNGGSSGFLRNVSGNNTWNGDITIGASTSRIQSDSGSLTIGGNITQANNAIFQGAGNISITGVISGSNFVMGGTMSGALFLSGNNTYTGSTNVNAGTLSVSSINNQSTNGVFGNNTAQVYLGATTNGTLQYTGSGVTTDRRIRVGGLGAGSDAGGAIIRNDGSGALVFNWSGQFNQVTGNTTANRTLTLGGTNTDLNTIQGAIVDNTASTGLVGLIKADAGTWVLSGSNTYSGATTINAGTLQIGAGSASGSLSTTSTITNNGTLVFNRSGNMTQGTNFANSISGTGNLTQAGSGTLFLGGTNSYTGLTTISAGNLSINAATAVGSTSGINLANATSLIYTGSAASLDRAISVTSGTGSIRNTGSALTLSGPLSKNGTTLTLAGGNNGITVSGVISGSANNSDLIIDGGTTTLTNANNSYNGPTFIINGATLNASVAGALPTSTLSAVTINGSSTLALGASQSIASLSGTSGSTVNLNNNTLTINGSATTTYSGGISGTGNLVKNGSGTQTLAGATTFNGTTTVNSGTLKADAAGAMGNSTVINVTGGSFLVTAENAVNDNAAINLGGGTLAVSGTFNENVGLLTLSADSIIDLNGFSGILRFGGVGSWAPSANLAIWNWNGINEYGTPVGDGVANRKIVFADNTGLSNYLDRISFYSGSNNSGFAGNAFQQSFGQSGFEGHQIIAVPEPETYITAVALLLGVTFYQIRLARHGQGLLARLTFLRRRAKRKPLGGSSSRMTQISNTERVE